MPESYIFDKYDPHQDCYPPELEWECVGASHVVQSILKNRSREDISQIIWDIDKVVMKDEGGPSLTMPNEKLSCYGGSEQVNYLVRQMTLKNPIEKITSVKGVQWAELYAVAALALLAFAEHDAEQIRAKNPTLTEDDLFSELMTEVGLNVVIASQAAGLARAMAITEGLQGWQDPATTEKHLRHNIASSGGGARAEKYLPIKHKAIELWLEHYQHHTNSAAAKHIETRLRKDHPQLWETTPAKVRTIANWISRYKTQHSHDQ